jgi:dolichol-phosphate mannosyltransferase
MPKSPRAHAKKADVSHRRRTRSTTISLELSLTSCRKTAHASPVNLRIPAYVQDGGDPRTSGARSARAVSSVSKRHPAMEGLARRENHASDYRKRLDPIASERLIWQAHIFRHLVHLLPGETILEIGSGDGSFTAALATMSRGRNKLVSVTATGQAAEVPDVEAIALDSLPGPLAGRRFQYIVAQNILDRETVSYVMEHAFALLEDGGRGIFIETNPWNPMSAARQAIRDLFTRSRYPVLLSRTQLYELLSEIGFIRVSARFTDFVYRPFTPTPGMARVMRNASVLLENMPLIQSLAGRIVLHSQRPPRNVERPIVSLCGLESLRHAVSFVIPCHDEEMNIPALVNGLRGYYGDYVHEIVLVNDNSRDATGAVIDGLAADDPRIVPVHRSPPNGVGNALRDGYAAASGAWVMSMDCDFQHLLPEMEEMFEAAAAGADVVFGSRFSRRSVLINYPFGKILDNRSFHVLANMVVRLGGLRDVTNNLRLMRGDLARRLVINEPWFAANAEIGLQLALLGKSVHEVPISWINRTFDMGQSSFKVLKSGAGYARVLWRFARLTRFGRRALEARPAQGV